MSIASEITRLQGAKSDLKASIEGKGVTVPSATKIDGYAALVDQIQQGSSNPEAGMNDVVFIDYDGTIRYSYSKADFANLTALPANPSHTGLTAQGWNWTLANAKTHVAACGSLIIGQMYITDDGKTRLYIRLKNTAIMTVPLYFSQTAANGVTIDWGDGSATATLAGTGNVNTTHTYTSLGSYVISLKVTSGTMALGYGSNSYSVLGASGNNGRSTLALLEKVEMGTSASFQNWAFRYCTALKSITMTNSITNINNGLFQGALGPSVVIMPSSILYFNSNAFDSNYGINAVSIPYGLTMTNLNSLVTYGYAFNKVTLPITATNIGSSAFYLCYSLGEITIPPNISTINSNAFYNCYGLKAVHLKPTTPPTLTAGAFTGVPANCVFYVPTGKLATYQGASNWSALSSQMQEE